MSRSRRVYTLGIAVYHYPVVENVSLCQRMQRTLRGRIFRSIR
jgi:hypothetical protein